MGTCLGKEDPTHPQVFLACQHSVHTQEGFREVAGGMGGRCLVIKKPGGPLASGQCHQKQQEEPGDPQLHRLPDPLMATASHLGQVSGAHPAQQL